MTSKGKASIDGLLEYRNVHDVSEAGNVRAYVLTRSIGINHGQEGTILFLN